MTVLAGWLRQLARRVRGWLTRPVPPTRPTAASSQPPQPPRRQCQEYSRYPWQHPNGLTRDQAAIAAVRDRLPQERLTDLAMREGLGRAMVSQASMTWRHAPDLADQVLGGTMPVGTSAAIARLRHDAPDLAAKAEARMTGDRWRDSRMLRAMQVKAKRRPCADRAYLYSSAPTPPV